MNRRAALIFTAAVIAYLVTVLQRSSLGVAAVDATARFDVQATVLSFLAVSQIIVYAVLQIPVGVLIDRFGPRLPLLVGAALMAVGQATLAFSEHIGPAIVARVLVGAGDATTFGAAIRLLAMWFPARRLPFVTQVFAQLGQLGQLLSAVPLMLLLHTAGWTPAFLSAAGLSVVAFAALLGATAAAGPPPMPHQVHRLSPRETVGHVLEALRRPGTQLGFWAHFVTQSSVTMFALLWGFPFLTVAVGLEPAVATGLLSLIALSGLVSGPLLGLLSARFPLRRSNIVLGIVAMIGIAWTVVLTWPGTPPVWLLVVLVVVISIGGPGSLIGFDYARTYNPMRQLGSANGVVNVGGFLATFTMMFLIGVALDLLHPRGDSSLEALYSLASFRLAFLVQFVVIGFGVVMLLVVRRRIRRVMRDEEGIVVAPLWVAIVRDIRSRRRRPGGPDAQSDMR